jgi:pimeloyl-ACP methyl ester carboxylesterase
LAASRIERNPDPFPLDRLVREPEGWGSLHPPTRRTVLRAVVAGDGPTVVLTHGYGATLMEWNVVWDALLARKHRVTAFDVRGHGRSTIGSAGIGSEPMAGDLVAVLEHFDVRDGVLVAHSTGGFIAIRALLDNSEVARRLRRLVLFATWAGRILDGAPQMRLLTPLSELGILDRLVRTRTGGVLFGAAQLGRRPSPAMISALLEMLLQQNRKALLPIARACVREDRYPRLAEISVPTVVMVGSADRTTPPNHARRLAAGVPGARLITVPDAGHMLNWEAAETLVDLIESFHE